MSRSTNYSHSLPARGLSSWQSVVLILVVLLIFAGALGVMAFKFRSMLINQILTREFESLQSVVLMHMDESESEPETFDDPDALLTVVLKTSRLKGVIGATLFDAQGRLVSSFPEGLKPPEAYTPQRQLSLPKLTSPFAEVRTFDSMDQIFESSRPVQNQKVAVLFVSTALKTSNESASRGSAVFLVEGETTRSEIAALTRGLIVFSALVFILGSGSISVFLYRGFQLEQRLNRALQQEQVQLSAKTAELLQLNHELTLLAKTSALGSVTANLLQVIQHFLRSESAEHPAMDWSVCREAAHRMRQLIGEVLKTLSEDRELIDYELTFFEVLENLNARIVPMAKKRGVIFKIAGSANRTLSNRQAHLILLVLQNLIQNSIEATESGKTVWLQVEQREHDLAFRVEDQGGGLPPSSLKNLFRPTSSTKPGGSGLGLAISKQLARYLGGEIRLVKSDANGTEFALLVPWKFAPVSEEKLAVQNHAA